uniref:Uncharacterized protein n=1 Tax=Nothoprocta perdicaria TaxID=30464 RepID=A0A8C6ZNQ0_NOTPE
IYAKYISGNKKSTKNYLVVKANRVLLWEKVTLLGFALCSVLSIQQAYQPATFCDSAFLQYCCFFNTDGKYIQRFFPPLGWED